MENTSMSKKTKEGMSLTVDDQKWIKLLFDRQDEINLSNFTRIIESFENKLNALEEKFFVALDKINGRLDSIEDSIDDKDARLKIIERHISPSGTLVRVGLGVAIGIIISVIIFILLHPYLKSTISELF
jgi:hypothetical protein